MWRYLVLNLTSASEVLELKDFLFVTQIFIRSAFLLGLYQ
jgi:hypothetical protein